MRGWRGVAAAMAAFGLAGCASVTGGNVQKMYVQAQMDDGSGVPGAECVLSNDKGHWSLRTPGDASIVRSNKPIEVKCDKAPLPQGIVSVESGTRAAMFGNILIGGIVGAAIDHSSGAAYEYPEQIRVVMGRMTSKPWVAAGPSGPPATGFAALDDAARVPYVGPKGREAYQHWLARPNPKAFAVATNGHFHAAWGDRPGDRTLPFDTTERALVACERSAQMPCKLYAVNDNVVWVKDDAPMRATPAVATVASPQAAMPAPMPVATPVATAPQPARLASGYALIDDVDAVPYLSDKGRENYREWLTRPTPKAFAISSAGHWFGAWSIKPGDPSHPTDPSERALFVCAQRAQMPCKLYAVNGSVVWVKEVRVSQP